jgi:hypothetical protein
MKPEELKKELAEFESLVNEVRGDCDRCKMACRDRLHILGYAIEALRMEREALAAERRKLRAEREQLHALHTINMRVLKIVNAPKSRREKWQKDDSSNRCRTLDAFAKNTS